MARTRTPRGAGNRRAVPDRDGGVLRRAQTWAVEFADSHSDGTCPHGNGTADTAASDRIPVTFTVCDCTPEPHHYANANSYASGYIGAAYAEPDTTSAADRQRRSD